MTYTSDVVTCTSPANIAFLKYWGKDPSGPQWPTNNSLSMTLKNAVTVTQITKSSSNRSTLKLNGYEVFADSLKYQKVFAHVEFLAKRLKSLFGSSQELLTRMNQPLEINSTNHFPTGSGIASSASAFSALTVGYVAWCLRAQTWEELELAGISRSVLANLARMGSGSASRSLFDGFVEWSRGQSVQSQSIQRVHPCDWWDLTDTIVILSDKEKSISSSEGHSRVWTSPIFRSRLSSLPIRLDRIKESINQKCAERLGNLLEEEALEMHHVASTGSPPLNYLTDETLKFLEWLRLQRSTHQLRAWFTIDAGPNVHVIAERKDRPLLLEALKRDWPETKLILDEIGHGPSWTWSPTPST
jgi:diphosphomevalonate decarboxylase